MFEPRFKVPLDAPVYYFDWTAVDSESGVFTDPEAVEAVELYELQRASDVALVPFLRSRVEKKGTSLWRSSWM